MVKGMQLLVLMMGLCVLQGMVSVVLDLMLVGKMEMWGERSRKAKLF